MPFGRGSGSQTMLGGIGLTLRRETPAALAMASCSDFGRYSARSLWAELVRLAVSFTFMVVAPFLQGYRIICLTIVSRRSKSRVKWVIFRPDLFGW